MAITLLEYNRRLDGVIKDLQAGAHGQVMVQIAHNALAMVKERVQERGLNPEGGKYRDYSPQYKKYKQKEGKYRGFVDFTFSSRMWTNIKLVSPKDELEMGIAVIKATAPEEIAKLRKNTDSRGDILALSDDEVTKLTRQYEQGILDIWRKNGLL